MSQGHHYLPLDASRKEIRLIIVSRRSQHIPYADPVRCSIRHISLRDTSRPSYETVSYIWGDAKVRSTIYLNDEEVAVPATAEQALKCIRLHTGDRDRVLWIDAVCINQNDTDERTKQVNIMGDIFRLSAANLIYLGEDDGRFGRACLDFRHLIEEVRQDTDGFRTFLDTVFDRNRDTWRHADSSLRVKIDTAALVSFYSRPWFQRIWVIQEIALPTRSLFICGPFEISALTVLRVSAWLQYKEDTLPEELRMSQGRDNAVSMAYIAAGTGILEGATIKNVSLGYLMALSTRFDATEPRDHIFAIVDLLRLSAAGSSSSFELIAPEYAKPVAQVFRDATIFWLIHEQSLRIWRNVYHRKSQALDLYSSWTPQWHRVFDATQDAHRMPEHFDACFGTKVSSPSLSGPVPTTPDILIVYGFQLGRIDRLTPTFSTEGLQDLVSLKISLLEIDKVLNDQQIPANSERDEGVAAALLNGHDSTGYTELVTLLQQDQFVPGTTSDEELTDPTDRARRYHNLFCRYGNQRCFFSTSNGYWGTGTSVVQTGDVVAILYGAPWPVILRPIVDNFHFLTQAYIPGVMHGEAVQEHRARGALDESFSLL